MLHSTSKWWIVFAKELRVLDPSCAGEIVLFPSCLINIQFLIRSYSPDLSPPDYFLFSKSSLDGQMGTNYSSYYYFNNRMIIKFMWIYDRDHFDTITETAIEQLHVIRWTWNFVWEEKRKVLVTNSQNFMNIMLVISILQPQSQNL